MARREAKLITVFGKVTYRRAYHLCPTCRTGCAPLDQRLMLAPGQVSRGLAPLLGLLGIGEAFDKAQKKAQHLLLLEISDNTIRKATQQLGETQALREEEWQDQSKSLAYLRGIERRQEPQPRRLYGSPDGVLVPIGPEWQEMKVGSWYEVEALPRRRLGCSGHSLPRTTLGYLTTFYCSHSSSCYPRTQQNWSAVSRAFFIPTFSKTRAEA